MIEKIKEKLSSHPTWVGVSILFIVSFALSLISVKNAERIAKQTAVNEVNIAVGNRIDELGKILEGFRKLEITQTNNQQINLPPTEAELHDRLRRDLLKSQGSLVEKEK